MAWCSAGNVERFLSGSLTHASREPVGGMRRQPRVGPAPLGDQDRGGQPANLVHHGDLGDHMAREELLARISIDPEVCVSAHVKT